VDLYGGINEFKKGYRPRNNILKGEKADLVADSHSILASWRKYYSQLQNIFDARQTAELLVPRHNAFDFQIAIETIKKDINHRDLIKSQQK
jgi:hypothetical protein